MPVPTLLIIDTPLKNITPDINPDIVTAFYQYLYRVAENDLRDHQIVIIDQLLVEPPPEITLDFTSRLMTENDSSNPPLISYYRGP
jgi:Pyruvate/2-oxoacid:ferredoxin oxidoreductase gamma subunit